MDIGLLIKTIRTKKGISQKELSEMLDISTNYLCLVESGKRNPSKELIEKIAEKFSVSRPALDFLCNQIPEELDKKNAKKFIELQENIAALIFFQSDKVA